MMEVLGTCAAEYEIAAIAVSAHGGREYAEICAKTGSATDQQATEKDIAQIIRNGVMALPNFSSGSGPFGDRAPEYKWHCSQRHSG